MPRIFLFALVTILTCSCASKHKVIRVSSIFSQVALGELETSKDDFIVKYGEPVSKDIVKLDNTLIESLYYVEIIDDIVLTTKFTFLNNSLIEQSTSINNNFRTMEKLKDEIRQNRLKMIRNK